MPTADQQPAFRALADPSRRMIMMHLAEGDMTIAALTDRFDMTRAAVKKHLTVLEEGRLISVHRRGRERINHLEPAGLGPVRDWIAYFERFWDDRLQALQTAIDEEESNDD